jgi:hypothetical protein
MVLLPYLGKTFRHFAEYPGLGFSPSQDLHEHRNAAKFVHSSSSEFEPKISLHGHDHTFLTDRENL